MLVPLRLKWIKAKKGFIAYPIGLVNRDSFAAIDHYHTSVGGDAHTHTYTESWRWRVHWEGWFVEAGFGESKQAAADMATEKWWQMVQTELPRNVELEAAMIAARVLVRPPPNSLFDEDSEFLHKVLWQLKNAHGHELQAGTATPQVSNFMEQLTAEMDRRRAAGTLVDAKPYVPSHPIKRRRR